MTPNDELRRLAEAATPGEWAVDNPDGSTPNIWIIAPSSSGIAKIETCDYDDGLGERLTAKDHANAAYIAAANPARILCLLDEVERLGAENVTLKMHAEARRILQERSHP